MKQILLIALIAFTTFSSNAMESNHDPEKGQDEKRSLFSTYLGRNRGSFIDSRIKHQGVVWTFLILGLTTQIYSYKKFDNAERALAQCNPDAASSIESLTALAPMIFTVILGISCLVHIVSK